MKIFGSGGREEKSHACYLSSLEKGVEIKAKLILHRFQAGPVPPFKK